VPLIVRPCRLEECAQVLALWRQAEAIPRPTDTLGDVERMVREYPGTLLVGEEAGRLVGSVIAGFDGWRGGIYRLAVLPECRRRGVAQALVAEAERRVSARGARRLSAMVARDEPQAVAFWNAAPGWAVEPRWHRYAKDL
jgi:ribosomal protein S18 acetylase RimI-like enzyme